MVTFDITNCELVWFRSTKVSSRLEDYPLHNSAAQGNADGIRHYLRRGWSVSQRDVNSFTAIHYAAKWATFLLQHNIVERNICFQYTSNVIISGFPHL